MMKKTVLVILCIIAFSGAKAQQVKFGVKAGLNVATIHGENLNTDSKLGLHVGGLVELKLSDSFSIQPEVLYSQMGTENDANQLKIDYISLPVMAKYYIVDGFSLELGPQISFLVDDVVKTNDGGSLDPDIENYDLSANLGLGYQFKQGLFVQTRYNLGLTAIQENPDIKNGSFQISVGYQF